MQRELFSYILEYFLAELLFSLVIAHDRVFEVVSAHPVYEHVEGDAFAGQLPRGHVLEEFVDLRSLVGGVRTLDDLEELGKFNHARLVIVHCINHVLDLLTRFGKAKADQRVLKFFDADGSRAIGVQGPKALFEFRNLMVFKCEYMSLPMLYEPLSLLLVMEVLDLHLVALLPLGTGHHLPVPVLDDLLVLIAVVILLVHHVMRAVALRYS